MAINDADAAREDAKAKREALRVRKLREALYIMIGIDAIAFIVFWLVQFYMHNPNLAFALLMVGLIGGATIYVFQSHKLRPKD